MNDQEFFEALARPFPLEAVSWRVGSTNINKQTGKPPEGRQPSGMALGYIDARDVMERLDEVCGPAGWQDRYPHANGKTVCEIGIKVGPEWIWKADGAGDTDHEAEKGALSDAFKRAAVRWGIGRYLYGLGNVWVEIEARGRSWIIKDGQQATLNEALQKITSLQEWGTPAERATLRSLCNVAKKYLKTPADVLEFRTESAGEINLLRVKAREHLQALLGRIADGEEYDQRTDASDDGAAFRGRRAERVSGHNGHHQGAAA